MLAHYDERGVDIRAYTEYLAERSPGEPESTFLFPVTEQTMEVIAIMQPVIESILDGTADPASVLPAANERVNALFRINNDSTAKRKSTTISRITRIHPLGKIRVISEIRGQIGFCSRVNNQSFWRFLWQRPLGQP